MSFLRRYAVYQTNGTPLLTLTLTQLESAKSTAADHKEFVQSLQGQIETLEAEMTKARDNIEELKNSNAAVQGNASATVSVEHTALQKAHENMMAIKKETDALTAAHTQALEEAHAKVKALEEKAAKADSLAEEVAQLHKEREETSAKLSELEVEVLELKEAQEEAEDARASLEKRVKELEASLQEAQSAQQAAGADVSSQAEEHRKALEELRQAHDQEKTKITEDLSTAHNRSKELEGELVGVRASHEKTKEEVVAAAEAHIKQLQDSEVAYVEKHSKLSQEIQRLTAELDGQEDHYNGKVAAVKAEHDKLLQEAFEKAKVRPFLMKRVRELMGHLTARGRLCTFRRSSGSSR
jgi:chromosome segregation ATPase